MVAHFVRNHIGLGKIAGRAQLAAQGVVESSGRCRPFHPPGSRTVPWPTARAASRGRGTAKQHQARLAVLGATLLEHLAPHVLGAAQHGGHKRPMSSVGAGAGPGAGWDWVCVGAIRSPPPLSAPRMVMGLMPKIQPATSATTMVPRPMLRPPVRRPPPPPNMPPPPGCERRSSTWSDWRLFSHFMVCFLRLGDGRSHTMALAGTPAPPSAYPNLIRPWAA
jgi:hypothetical protein